MDKQNNIEKFLNDAYKDFDIDYCNGGLALMWIVSSFLYIFGSKSWICGIIFTVINIIVSVLFSVIKKKYANFKLARYLFNAIVITWITLFATTVAYRTFVAFDKNNNWLLYLSLMILSALTVFISALLWYRFIILKKESKKTKAGKIYPITILFALCGYFFAPVISQAMNSDTDTTGVGGMVVLLSLIMAICDGFVLLKLYLFLQDKENIKKTIDGKGQSE